MSTDVLWLVESRAEGALQPAQPRAGVTPLADESGCRADAAVLAWQIIMEPACPLVRGAYARARE